MMFCINPGSIVSRLGAPLHGRVTFYRHDTDELATIYTLEGQDFVQAANPQILDINGRLDDSVFFDCGIIDVRIEQYTGPEGFLSVDAPDEYFAAFDIFEYGIKLDDGGTIGHVETIADLREVSPDAKFVWVNGYYAVGDAPSRLYYWDEASEDIEDGGYVVGSDVEGATGKWILLWGDEVLPCTVYGVKPGTEANLAAFLDYPALVGSMSLKTAPCLRFVRGQYTTAESQYTDRTLCFDTGAQFLNAPQITCPEVRTFGPVSGYIGNFKFASSGVGDAVAHSSWFKDASDFLECRAYHLVIDETNYFTNTSIQGVVEAKDALIEGNSHIAFTYAADSYIKFDNCKFNASAILNASTDYVRFLGCERWPREIWLNYTAASFEFGTDASSRTQFRTTDANVLDISDFANPDIFIKSALANGATSIDLRGNTAQGFESSDVTEIKNGYFSTAVTLHNASVTVSNCSCSINVDTGAYVTLKGGEIALYGAALLIESDGCDFTAGTAINPKDTQAEFRGGTFTGDIQMSDSDLDNGHDGRSVVFWNCRISDGANPFKLTNLMMHKCVCEREIKIYPFIRNAVEKVDLSLVDNYFIGNFFLEFCNPPTRDVVDCSNVIIYIVNNVFGQTDISGLRAPLYSNLLSQFWSASNVWTYHGNTGNCPKEYPDEIYSDSLTDTYVDNGDTVHYGEGLSLFNLLPNKRFDSTFTAMVYDKTDAYSNANALQECKFVHMTFLLPGDNNVFKVYFSWSDGEDYAAGKKLKFLQVGRPY